MTSTPSSVARAHRAARRQRPARRPRALAAALAVAVAATGAVVVSEPAAAQTMVYDTTVPAGTTLYPGDSVASPNGQFTLVLQGDGNLVEYGIGGRVVWASNTSNQPGAVLKIGRNRAVDLVRNGKRVVRWSSAGTKASTAFKLRGDGTMALLVGTTSIVNWTGFQDRVAAGNTLQPGTALRSDPKGTNRLGMQPNGNLVQTVGGRVAWSSGTAGHPGAWAELRQDGNLVVWTKGADGKQVRLWSTGTGKAGAGNLLVQVDGNVVLYGGKDTRVWSTKPVTGMLWPVNGTTITGRYGDDRGAGHVPRYHQGADAPVKVGTPVYGSGTGTVTTTVTGNGSYGNYIVVTYGVTTVLTAHLSKIEVKKGQIITSRTEIGKSGNTGQSTGPHVHVETRRNGTLFDPLSTLHFR